MSPQNAPELSFPLCQYIDEQVDAIRRHVPPALREFDETSIHQARVGTRRLKAALDLLKPLLPEQPFKQFSKIGRKIRRRLGPLRDLDVMLGHLQKEFSGPRHVKAVQWLTTRLQEARNQARRESQEGKSPSEVLAELGSWWGLRESVLETRQAVPSLLAESLHRQFDEFSQQAEMLCAQKDQTPDPEVRLDPHELRIAGKALRYTLEMAQRQGHPLPDSVLKSFKKMQDDLGLWHDYVVLAERAMLQSVEHMLPHHDAPLQRAVLDLTRLFLTRAEAQLRHFATLWTRSGQSLEQTVRELIPREPSRKTQSIEKPEGSD